MRQAIIQESTNTVINIIRLTAGSNWTPPAGHSVIPCEEADVTIGDTYEDGEFISTPLPPDPAAFPRYLAAYRWQKEIGGIETGGIKVRTDRETQAMLTAARTKAKEDTAYTLVWKADNGFFTLDAAAIIGIADAVHDHVQKCFAAEAAVDLADCDDYQDIEDAFDTALAGQ